MKHIGGSEIADVLNRDPFWCARRLYYRLAKVEPDFPHYEEPTPLMLRGIALEDVVAAEFARRNGWKVRRRKTVRHERRRALVDRLIVRGEAKTPGILEVKTTNSPLRELRENGSITAWTDQLIWYLGTLRDARILRAEWGALGICHVPLWQFHTEIIEFDRERYNSAREAANEFLCKLEAQDPPAAPRYGARCVRCAWRSKCQGVEKAETPADAVVVDEPELEHAAEAYEVARAGALAAIADADRARERLVNALAGRSKVVVGAWKIALREIVQKRIDVKALEATMPDIAARFKIETKSTMISVKYTAE